MQVEIHLFFHLPVYSLTTCENKRIKNIGVRITIKSAFGSLSQSEKMERFAMFPIFTGTQYDFPFTYFQIMRITLPYRISRSNGRCTRFVRRCEVFYRVDRLQNRSEYQLH